MVYRSRINFLETADREPEDSTVSQIVQPTEAIQPTRSKYRSIFFIAIIIFLIGAISLTGLYLIARSSNSDQTTNTTTLTPKKPNSLLQRLGQLIFFKDQDLSGKKEDRINILLLGMGGPGHDGPYLTDTIMIVSIKPSTGQVAMVSIPRDLGVDIPGYGLRKINSANSYGETKKSGWGGAFTTEVVSKTFDLDIQYYIRVDFKAFQEIIDEVGGVRVVVDNTFTDPLFPLDGTIEYQTVRFEKGAQTMDGKTALNFARSRHGNNGEGSDFARASRQQKVMLALKEKVLSFETLLNPIRLNTIIKSLDNHVQTNLSFDEMLSFLKMSKELHTDQLTRVVFDNSIEGPLRESFNTGAGYLLLPKDGSFLSMQQTIANIFAQTAIVKNDTPAQERPIATPAVIEVQNGTWIAGMAARIKKRVEDEGVLITTIGNTAERPVSKSGIYALDSKAPMDTMQSLVNILHIPILEKNASTTASVASSTEILIILGEDFHE